MKYSGASSNSGNSVESKNENVSTNKYVAKGKSDPYFAHMGKLYKEKTFSDVKFVVEGVEIPAHRSIVAVRCKFFGNMFLSN